MQDLESEPRPAGSRPHFPWTCLSLGEFHPPGDESSFTSVSASGCGCTTESPGEFKTPLCPAPTATILTGWGYSLGTGVFQGFPGEMGAGSQGSLSPASAAPGCNQTHFQAADSDIGGEFWKPPEARPREEKDGAGVSPRMEPPRTRTSAPSQLALAWPRQQPFGGQWGADLHPACLLWFLTAAALFRLEGQHLLIIDAVDSQPGG